MSEQKKETVEEASERVISAMHMYGGSFVKSLSDCFRHADVQNFQKLKDTFPEYWKQYDEMSRVPEDTPDAHGQED